jgi:hypothetical protein
MWLPEGVISPLGIRFLYIPFHLRKGANMRIRSAVAATALAAVAVLGGAGAASANSTAVGSATNSPGVLSGNLIQVPIDVPINLCGNSIGLVSLLNPSFGNRCVNSNS